MKEIKPNPQTNKQTKQFNLLANSLRTTHKKKSNQKKAKRNQHNQSNEHKHKRIKQNVAFYAISGLQTNKGGLPVLKPEEKMSQIKIVCFFFNETRHKTILVYKILGLIK